LKDRQGAYSNSKTIEAGDVIISVNEKAVSDYKELLAELSPLSPSSVAKVGVQRNGKALTLNVKLTAFTYGPDGQMASNGAQLLADGRQDLAKVLTEVTKLCQYCKYSMFSLFCR
jgi:PDZ domain-containing secreted protein